MATAQPCWWSEWTDKMMACIHNYHGLLSPGDAGPRSDVDWDCYMNALPTGPSAVPPAGGKSGCMVMHAVDKDSAVVFPSLFMHPHDTVTAARQPGQLLQTVQRCLGLGISLLQQLLLAPHTGITGQTLQLLEIRGGGFL